MKYRIAYSFHTGFIPSIIMLKMLLSLQIPIITSMI